jgi:nicotinamidase/pyrazinamidase
MGESMSDRVTPTTGDALLVVDVQNDFLPGGSLGVADGDAVIPVLNSYIEHFFGSNLPIVFTRDWHPRNHCSFSAQGGPWPVHCVANTSGAEFASGLAHPAGVIVVDKAESPKKDAYSGFEQTALAQELRERGVRRVYIGGLTTDYCVLNTVRDALSNGFQVFLLEDAIRAVNIEPEDGRKAVAQMLELGAMPIELGTLQKR